MSISMVLYISVVVLTVIVLVSYVAVKRAKSLLKLTADEILEEIQMQQQTKINDLEKN